MHILYLTPHVPNPTKIASHFHIQGLKDAGHKVTIATLERNLVDAQHIAKLRDKGFTVLSSRLTRFRSVWNTITILSRKQPLQSTFMWSANLMYQIEDLLKSQEIDIIHVEHLRMAIYGLRLCKQYPTIWDAIDHLSSLYEQASRMGSGLALRIVARIEAPRLAEYETWLTGQFPATLVITERDKLLFQSNNPYADKVQVVNFGLPIIPLQKKPRASQTIAITGTLNYHPNVASVHYFVSQVFPLIQRMRSNVHLQLVGANPLPSIKAYQSNSITITGYVPSIVDYLSESTVALAPVLYGSGMQIKVIEAFLTATPLVATSVALRGLDVKDGQEVLVADTPKDFADAVSHLLNDADLRERIGRAGRRYIEEHHDLRRTTQSLVDKYNLVISEYDAGKRLGI